MCETLEEDGTDTAGDGSSVVSTVDGSIFRSIPSILARGR